ncbi:hypothetical protein [Bradyrhizobium lablabi]|nr:hypothetical protein [Bradyrhizobium lablabi]
MNRRAFVGLAAAAAVSTLFQRTAVTVPAYMALAKDLMAGG